MPRLLALLLSLSLLSGCGFKLRGEWELPAVMQQLQLRVADQNSVFARGLQRSLSRSGIEIVTAAEAAGAILEVPVNQVRRDILSIGDNARVREFRIRHILQFRLLDASGDELIPLQHLELHRDLSFDETEILASSREQEFVSRELAQSMVRLVQLRLSQFQL